MARRPSLRLVFTLGSLLLPVGLLLLFALFAHEADRALGQQAQADIAEATRQAGDQVETYLAQASHELDFLVTGMQTGRFSLGRESELQQALATALAARRDLSEVTVTVASGPLSQLSVLRVDGRLRTRWVRPQPDGGHAVSIRDQGPDGQWLGPPQAAGTVTDPALHSTYTTLVSDEFRGQRLWTDLHRPQLLDQNLTVSVQQAWLDGRGQALGVARVGLFVDEGGSGLSLDATVAEAATPPHQVFLCDPKGRLLTDPFHLAERPPERRSPHYVETPEEDLRLDLVPAAEVREALTALPHPDQGWRFGSNRTGLESANRRLRVNGQEYLVGYRALDAGQEWLAVVVVPEAYYLGPLQARRTQVTLAALLLMVLLIAVDHWLVQLVRRDLQRLGERSANMQQLHFGPTPVEATFAETGDVLQGLESAKTALRALGKYAPVALVRRLYSQNQEPQLGGEVTTVALMFTDIKNFTTLAESMQPAELAPLLGRYLEVMTATILETEGTIDKYIGDAVMAIWNAPGRVEAPAHKMCQAALNCVAACQTLFTGSDWQGRPELYTRFGLHYDAVMVGHFGSPERMNYTAIGDGVNLASRLEGLNKSYGTQLLVSQAVVDQVGESFRFRRLDRVAVKGKTHGVMVYELLSPRGVDPRRVAAYEAALELYFSRDFQGALERLADQCSEDPPSRVLAERCRAYLAAPPPPEWTGVYASREK